MNKHIFLRLLVMLILGSYVTTAPANDSIEVRGGNFFREGKLWVAKGVTLVGYVAPMQVLKDFPAYYGARKKFSKKQLDELKKFNADLIRFQISQGGLDPESPIYDTEYKSQVLEAIHKARTAGFNVIVSMQWQKASGSPDEGGLPTKTTERAWEELVHSVADDKGILLELFNEPNLRKPTPENWRLWKTEMQEMIDYLRNMGAENVLLADGLRAAHFLGGAPKLEDPLNQIAYAVHPYLDKVNQTKRQWDKNFGDFSDDNPVMATEFMADAGRACRKSLPMETKELLAYLKGKDIGLVVWGFDLGSIKRGKKFTTFNNLSCEKEKGGAGKIIHEYYKEDV